jgi:ubiquinone biosynthesis protein UbiJ
MPAAQLFCSAIEKGLNTLLNLDHDSQTTLQKLKGKRLLVSINELPFDFLLVASQQIDVLSVERGESKHSADSQQPKTFENTDCFLKTSLFTLPELQDTSRLTQLIKQDKLQLEGDIQLAQAFSQLFLKLNIDWEEQLAKQTNDVFAHEVFRIGKSVFSAAGKLASSIQSMFSEAAIEEKRIAAPKTLVSNFSRDVQEVQNRTDALEQRMSSFNALQTHKENR